MDAMISAAARALAAGDALGALKRVSLREDPPALALRGDPDDGTVLERLRLPEGIGVSGLEADDGELFYCGGGNSKKVRAVRRPKAA